MMLNGMEVRPVSLSCTGAMVSVRLHSPRRNQRKESYHRRVQKKWNRRFGREWREYWPRGEVRVMNVDSFLLGAQKQIMLVREDDFRELECKLKTTEVGR